MGGNGWGGAVLLGCGVVCQVGIKKLDAWLLAEMDFVDSGIAEGTETADAPAVGLEAVGSCDLLPLAFDLEEGRLANAVAALDGNAQVARLLKFVEQFADLRGKLFGAAQVEGALASIFTVDEPVVGAESLRAARAVGGDDRADLGEECGVLLDEVEW